MSTPSLLKCAVVLGLGLVLNLGSAFAQPFALHFSQPSLDRWVYPFNASPGTRPVAATFAAFGDDSGMDTRHAQFLLGFDTFSQVATNLGPSRYLISGARLKATISRDLIFKYDPSQDALSTFLPTNSPSYSPDLDEGRPIELFGVGYHNGFSQATFLEASPFGAIVPGQRNCFATSYNSDGVPVDVSNNVGKTNQLFPNFEVHPFSIGQTESVAPGEWVPAGSQFTFDLNLSDPLVLQYVQEALNTGRLRLMLSSLHASERGAEPAYPEFYTRDSLLGDPPTLELQGTAVSSVDGDSDGLPDDWEQFYFSTLSHSGDEDTDGDGVTNANELLAGTNPNQASSALHILSAERQADGSTRVRFTHSASQSYGIQTSDDLKNWSPVENPVLHYYQTEGAVEWQDQSNPAGALHFYRVVIK